LEKKLRIIVVVNKIDKQDARVDHVLDKTLDLFLELGADDDTADFPIVYASAKEGKAGLESDLSVMTDISPIFDAILQYIPSLLQSRKPRVLLMTTLSRDDYKGRIATGRL
jgi:GTP-binding protein